MERPTAEALYRSHHLTVFRFLRRLTGDTGLSEDIAQDVFVHAIHGLASYDARERDLAWLFRIARRIVLDRARSAVRRPILVPPNDSDAAPVGPVQHLTVALEEALGLLPDAEREAFLMREQGGLSYDEIASIVDASPAAVRNRIHRARCQLRRVLRFTPDLEARSAARSIRDES